MASHRVLRVSEIIRNELAMMLVKGEVADPRLQPVTIQKVSITADLQIARVHYSVFGDESEKKGAEIAWKKANGFIRRKMAKVLNLRVVPHFEFYIDSSAEHAARISSLISDIKKEADENN